ncbi:putative metal-dependent phosphoesterase TrpH [Sporosarcina luteola]|nr:putative metal-dependent phosphoesterase TrpH [Sporosarcina luteola]
MKIDFHTHGKLSKKVNFSLDYFMELVQAAKENDLDAIALTEHFNTHRFSDVYDTLDDHFPYIDHYYEVDGLKVFPGMEVDIKETGHILVIGKRTDLLELRKKLDPYTEKGSFIPFQELLKEAASAEFLVIGGHPYRESTPLHHLAGDLLAKLDAFDLNGKDLYEKGIEKNSREVYSLAEQIGIPVVGGSDTHQSLQYGAVVNVLDVSCRTVREFKDAIRSGAYRIEISTELDEKVAAAKELKKRLKEKMEKVV